ncbi:phage/plasmid primase, P4 family [Amycolatopsis sp. NPDC048633]|uniref:DNA primase family protein n=1 Tax=Amycolatopsis sp. NPDC048633 TaxID=3157095 RepID=UPI003408EB08
MTDWNAAVAAITPEPFTPLARAGALADLADRLRIQAQNDSRSSLRRMLTHLRHCGVDEDRWPRLAALHPYSAGTNPAVVVDVVKDEIVDHDLTELGLARRIADQHIPNLAWAELNGGWALWDGRRWRTSDTKHQAQALAVRTVDLLKGEVARAEAAAKIAAEDAAADETLKEAADGAKAHAKAVRAFAQRAQSARTIANALTLSHSEGLAVDAEKFDADPALLTVTNGTLVLGQTAHLREHRRADRLTRVTAAPYDPDARSDEWDAFVAHVIPDAEARAYAQRLMGYTLFGENTKRKLIFLKGPTSSGKSTFLKIIGKVLGDHAGPFSVSLFAGKQTDAARPDILKALPRRLIYADDPPERWAMQADEIKSLAGNAVQEARRMRADEFVERVPAFTGWIACNKPPTIVGVDQALWRRLVVVPCGDPVDTEDTTLETRLSGEHAAAVLAWCVRGWNAYRAEGIDNPPHAVDVATLELRDSLSVLDTWRAEYTEPGAEYTAVMADLWESFKAWCDYAQIKDADRLTLTAFGRGLADRGYSTRKVGPKDKRVTARMGLRLRAVEDADRLTP